MNQKVGASNFQPIGVGINNDEHDTDHCEHTPAYGWYVLNTSKYSDIAYMYAYIYT